MKSYAGGGAWSVEEPSLLTGCYASPFPFASMRRCENSRRITRGSRQRLKIEPGGGSAGNDGRFVRTSQFCRGSRVLVQTRMQGVCVRMGAVVEVDSSAAGRWYIVIQSSKGCVDR